MALLDLRNIVKTYPVEGGVLRRKIGLVPALKGVSLSLEAGRSLGLVGESGSGKTTLGKIIARHLPRDGVARDVDVHAVDGQPAVRCVDDARERGRREPLLRAVGHLALEADAIGELEVAVAEERVATGDEA